MTDTERLATDRAYWDEVAPEGAEANILTVAGYRKADDK